jgi:hypothetical protein
MRTIFILLASTLALALCSAVFAQTRTYADPDLGYALDLPSPAWAAIPMPDGAHRHTGFAHGGGGDWRLRIHREMVDRWETAAALAEEEETGLRFLPAYVETGLEPFAGRLGGTRLTYEYSDGGRLMTGRTYYLQANRQTVYVLKFTGARDRNAALGGEADSIARSFRLR